MNLLAVIADLTNNSLSMMKEPGEEKTTPLPLAGGRQGELSPTKPPPLGRLFAPGGRGGIRKEER